MKQNKVDLKAVALGFKKIETDIPIILAKGENYLAEQITKIASENGIIIHQDKELIDLLDELLPNMPIPPESYLIVAEILKHIYTYNKSDKENF